MNLQVTAIAIDWQDEFDWIDPIVPEERAKITTEIIGSIWDVDGEDDLVDEISTAYGWLIESIDYRHVLTA
jgi:hypothetical protein